MHFKKKTKPRQAKRSSLVSLRDDYKIAAFKEELNKCIQDNVRRRENVEELYGILRKTVLSAAQTDIGY